MSQGLTSASASMPGQAQAVDHIGTANTQRNFLQRSWDAYERTLGRFVGWTARHFGTFGAFTARKPVLVLLTSLLIGLAICTGWARFRLEADNNVLWVAKHSKASKDQDYVKSLYPRAKTGGSFYAQLLPSRYSEFPDRSAIQRAVTWEMFQLHDKIMATTVSDKKGSLVSFKDICLKATDGTCEKTGGFLWFWNKDFNQYITSIGGSFTDPSAGDETAFRQRVQSSTYPDGTAVSLLSVFGGVTFNFNPIFVKKADVVANDYVLDDTVDDATAKRWHLAVVDLLLEELPKQQYMSFTFITGSSFGEELTKLINNDMKLIIVSLFVYIGIAILFLSKTSLVSTRTSLSLIGVFVTMLGIMCGWGWGMIFGLAFTPLQQLSPFILLGVGIDVMFILVKGYEVIIQREPWLTIEEAVEKLMSTAGLSVLVTLLASAVSFALGATDELASVQWFSAFAALNTTMILVLMLTMFIAALVLTERRIAAKRMDCYCCIIVRSNKGSLSTGRVAAALEPAGAADHVVAPVPPGAMSRALPSGTVLDDDSIKDENMIKRFMRKYYAPFLSKWYVKISVILFFVAWAVISWYGIYQLQYGQPLADLVSDTSYVAEYDRVSKATYKQQVGDSVGMYFRNIDISEPRNQYKMLRAWDMALQSEFVNASTTAFKSNWLISFLSYEQGQGQTVVYPGANCYNPLDGKVVGDLAGVNTPARRSVNGCVPQDRFWALYEQWGGSGSVILDKSVAPPRHLSNTFNLMLTAAADNDRYNADMIRSIRAVEKDINREIFEQDNDAAGSYSTFILGSTFVFSEGDAILPTQSMQYFILAMVGVGFVCTFMLVNPAASVLMMISVGLVVLYLFGELYALHIRFNQVSVINMIMATGLTVDYSVYFAQKFMTVTGDGTGDSRMKIAMTDTGSAVFLGGFTALCGTVPMAFSKSVIIRTFFFLIFGTILFALMVGLVFMPVVFSLVNIPPVKSALVVASGSDMRHNTGSVMMTSRSTNSVNNNNTEATKEAQVVVGADKA